MKHCTQCEVCKNMGFDDCKHCPKTHPEWWSDGQHIEVVEKVTE